MDLIKGTPCEAAIEKAIVLARQILAGEIDPFVGGTRQRFSPGAGRGDSNPRLAVPRSDRLTRS